MTEEVGGVKTTDALAGGKKSACMRDDEEQQDFMRFLDHFTKARHQKEARIDSTYTTLTHTSCEIHTRVDSRYTRLDGTHIRQCNIH